MNETDRTVHLHQRIVLTGFMGSGKTTCGPLLAARLGWQFVDVDVLIESSIGGPINEFFARQGEASFRQLEHETIASLLQQEGLVVALGGGAIEHPETRSMLLATAGTVLVHLEVELATTLLRCKGTEPLRPILADADNLAARYQRRMPLYRLAPVNLSVDERTPEEVVDAIVEACWA